MRAWLMRRWLSFRIRRIRLQLEDLVRTQEVLEASLLVVDRQLTALAKRWRAIRSQVDSLAPSAAASGQTTRPSSITSAPRLRVVSSARSA